MRLGNNVIHPSVILSLPPLPSSRHAGDRDGDNQKTRQGKEKRKRKRGARGTTSRGNQKATFPIQTRDGRETATDAHARTPPPLRWTMHVQVATVNLPSFQKLSVAGRLKATAHQALQTLCATYQATPCFGPLATGLLDPLNFPCTPRLDTAGSDFILLFLFSSTNSRRPHGIIFGKWLINGLPNS